MNYVPRHIDGPIQEALQSSGIVLIEGMRGCGKSESAKRKSASHVQLDRDPAALNLAKIQPSAVLSGSTPRLVDEWQLAPRLWNEARHIVDERQSPGQFIFTGSSTNVNPGVLHPGSARVIRLKMRTFTVVERNISSGGYSLSGLFEGMPQAASAGKALSLDELFELITVGGWPAYQNLTSAQAQRLHRNYITDILNLDLKAIEGPSDAQVAQRLLTAVARTLGQKVAVAKLVDLVTSSGVALRHQTAQAYLTQFEALWILEEIPAWVPHLRSRYSVTQAPKRYFGDVSLATTLLTANPAKLMLDLQTAGFVFENFVMSSLLSFMDALGGIVKHYRDESGLEVDAILEDGSGNWAALEIKLGFNAVDQAAAQLLKFASRVDTTVMGEPKFLAVVTNSSASYLREDGVHVIAINTLGL